VPLELERLGKVNFTLAQAGGASYPYTSFESPGRGCEILKDCWLSRKLQKTFAEHLLSASRVFCQRLTELFCAQVWFRLIESRFPRPAIIPSSKPSSYR
jgi:hypothetical protein